MITLDIRKMERPHRSGVVAVCAVYAALYIMAEVSAIGRPYQETTFKDLVVCHLLPILCIGHPPQETIKQYREYQVTKLIYCPACPVRKRKWHSHFDILHADGSLEHWLESDCANRLSPAGSDLMNWTWKYTHPNPMVVSIDCEYGNLKVDHPLKFGDLLYWHFIPENKP